MTSKFPRYQVLGVAVNRMTVEELNRTIVRAIVRRERLYVGSQNLHGVYAFHRDASMREFQELALVRVDGMPLVFAARLCGLPLERRHRITWVDWIDPLFLLAEEKGWTIAYCGASEPVMEAARIVIRERFPNLKFEGRNGYFAGPDEERQYVDYVNQLSADILIVGMGMPRQERFVLEHKDELGAPVVLTSGAAIEYLAGLVRTPPRWMGRLGLEWLFRLVDNPRRLARRYLIEPWSLLPLFLADLWRYRVRGGRRQ